MNLIPANIETKLLHNVVTWCNLHQFTNPAKCGTKASAWLFVRYFI